MGSGEGSGGLGLTLFLRRGMAAWIQAWSECAGSTDAGPTLQPSNEQPIPADLRSQIAALLAGMILCLQQEAIS